jgi:hypothetical protein
MGGRFQPGPDARRHRFTRAECQKGYAAALAKCMSDWELYAWFYSKIRSHYRKVKRRGKGKGQGKGKRPGGHRAA